VKLLSLASAVHLMPPNGSSPGSVIALFGDTEPGDERFVRVEAVAAVPVRGGVVRFSQPLKVVLAAQAVPAVQIADVPADQAAK
jgi:hypothetical protein